MKDLYPDYKAEGPPDKTNEAISRRKIKATNRRKSKDARKARRDNRQRSN